MVPRGCMPPFALLLALACDANPCVIPSGAISNVNSRAFTHATLSVVSFNLLYGGPFPGFLGDEELAESTLTRRLQLVIDGIVRVRPDVLVLQEVSTTRPDRHCNVLRRLLAGVNGALEKQGISYNAAYGRASSDPSGLTAYWEAGEAVLSRFEILAADVHPFEHQGTLGLENRIALRVTLKGAEGNLDVVGVHLHHEGGQTAEAQIDELLDEVVPRRGNHDPVILAGDFNLEPTSRGIRRLVELGWKDSWALVNGSSPGYTFGHDLLEDPASAATKRIDYIFGLGVEPRAAELLFDEALDVDPGSAQRWLWASDHSAVHAVLELEDR